MKIAAAMAAVGLGVLGFATGFAEASDSGADAVAVAIARDSGKPVEAYAAYARRLMATLVRLPPEALARVLEEHAGVVTGEQGAGGGDDGGTTAPPNDPTVDQPMIDVLNGTPWTPQGEIQGMLLDASPLSEAVLSEVVRAGFDVIAASVQVNVLMENLPLPEPVFAAVMDGQSQLSSRQLANLSAAQAEATGAQSP